MQKIINIKQGVTRMPTWRMSKPVDFQLCDGEHIAIVGPNGGGKSLFVDMITGAHPLLMNSPEYDFSPSSKKLASDNIQYISFRDSYGTQQSNYYLQLRWNQMEIDKETPTVGQLLEEDYLQTGNDTQERRALQKHLYELFEAEIVLSHILRCFNSHITEMKRLIHDTCDIGLVNRKSQDEPVFRTMFLKPLECLSVFYG